MSLKRNNALTVERTSFLEAAGEVSIVMVTKIKTSHGAKRPLLHHWPFVLQQMSISSQEEQSSTQESHYKAHAEETVHYRLKQKSILKQNRFD